MSTGVLHREGAVVNIEPFTGIAQFGGFNVIAKSTDMYAEYQGGVIATTRKTLQNEPEKVEAFIGAYLNGLGWVLDPANREGAESILGSRMPQIKPKAMTAVMRSLTSPKSGLTPSANLLDKGMEKVIELRSKYGGSATPIGSAEDFLDLKLYKQIV